MDGNLSKDVGASSSGIPRKNQMDWRQKAFEPKSESNWRNSECAESVSGKSDHWKFRPRDSNCNSTTPISANNSIWINERRSSINTTKSFGKNSRQNTRYKEAFDVQNDLTASLSSLSLSAHSKKYQQRKEKTTAESEKSITDSELMTLISQICDDEDEILIKLIKDDTGFLNKIHYQHQTENPTSIGLILELLAKVASFKRSSRLYQFIITILPVRSTHSSHFMTTQLMLLISNLPQHMKRAIDRHFYLKIIENLLFFLKFLLSMGINHTCDTVKNITALLTSQVNFIIGSDPSMSQNIFPDTIIIKLHELNRIIEAYEVKIKNGESNILLEPASDFRDIPGYPTQFDLSTDKKPFLQPNQIVGEYSGGVEHYLNTQFRLLREDFIRPLREGIAEFKRLARTEANQTQGNLIRKVQDLHVYWNVKITKVLLNPNGLIYEATFDTAPYRNYHWQSSKRLLVGSLICLSADNFNTFILASVAGERNERDLQCGRFYLKDELCVYHYGYHHGTVDLTSENSVFTVVESTVFFEAYRHNLEILKKFDKRNFPFQEYIINVKTDIHAPYYLTKFTRYNLEELLLPFFKVTADEINEWMNHYKPDDDELCDTYSRQDKKSKEKLNVFIRQYFKTKKQEFYEKFNTELSDQKDIEITVADDASWSSDNSSFGFNESQLEAFKAALTEEFVIIQGPPGTGKTYVGLRIVQALLANLEKCRSNSVVYKPKILVVCYTNHALDQFLQGISSFCDDIIRIGGNSQNRLIKAFNLSSIRERIREERSIPQHIKTRQILAFTEMSYIEFEVTELEHTMNSSTTYVLDAQLHPVINKFYQKHNRAVTLPIPVASWLGYMAVRVEQNTNISNQPRFSKMSKDYDDPDKAEINHIQNQRTIEDDSAINDFRKKLIAKKDYWEFVAVDDNSDDGQTGNDGFQFQKHERKRQKKVFEKELNQIEPMTEMEALNTDDLYSLNNNDRLRLYKFWLTVLRDDLKDELTRLRAQYAFWATEFQDTRKEEDQFIVDQCKVIAMTTTGAAKYHYLIDAIQPNILVVEEAAEVLEAHIITSLCKSTEHVILIGDHQQLRPIPAVFDLAKNYNLDVSLFERLVRNNLKYYQLKEQHRMHPNISSLLVPHIYQELTNHPSVSDYEEIKGMPSNVLFINHTHNENKIYETTSHMNAYEAKYVVELAQYLLMQGYKMSQITILTAYTGQLVEINRNIRSHQNKNMKNVHVFVVDSFQGEENDIIILSCVRSNVEDEIGFLRTPNRINVALSRAKMALYCIGNFDSYCKKSDIWAAVIQKVKNQQAFGNSFVFTCHNHPDQKNIVQEPDDFRQMPAGGCLKPCKAILECTHVCTFVCHIIDPVHLDEYKCIHRCEKFCSFEHQCSKTCHFYDKNCGPCQTLIKINGKCGHSVQIECGYVEDEIRVNAACRSPCGAKLLCGHLCKGTCGVCKQGRLHKNCYGPCERKLACGHACASRLCSDICDLCIDKECPERLTKCSAMELLKFQSYLRQLNCFDGESLHDMQINFKDIYDRLKTANPKQISNAELEKRKLLIDYLAKLKNPIEISLHVTEFKKKLPFVPIEKYISRINDTLLFLKKFENLNSQQAIHDLKNEVYLIRRISKAIHLIVKTYATNEATLDKMTSQFQEIFDAIPSIGSCDKAISKIFFSNIEKACK